ncbi:MAG: hypothetical protein V2A73_01315 [Pseudomonadota bacterium]
MKTMHLSYELEEIRHAVEAAHLLVDALVNESLEMEEDKLEAPRAASAVLALVSSRLNDVCRVIHGTVDPAAILARHNDGVQTDEPEVVFHPWSPEERARHARQELERTERNPRMRGRSDTEAEGDE